MALTREQKQKIIEDLKEKTKKQNIMVFVDFKGLKVGDLFELRNKLKEVNSQLKVAKKTLLRIVFKDLNTELSQKIEELEGQIAVIFGFEEAILPAKITYQFTTANPSLKILGGFFEREFKTAEEMITLAQLPTRDEILARLVFTVSAPISNLVSVLEGNLRNLVFIFSQIKPST